MNPNELTTRGDLAPILQRLDETLSLLLAQDVKRQSEVIYLTSAEVCAKYKLSKSQLKAMRDERLIPFAKPFGVLIYPQAEIEEIISKGTIRKEASMVNKV